MARHSSPAAQQTSSTVSPHLHPGLFSDVIFVLASLLADLCLVLIPGLFQTLLAVQHLSVVCTRPGLDLLRLPGPALHTGQPHHSLALSLHRLPAGVVQPGHQLAPRQPGALRLAGRPETQGNAPHCGLAPHLSLQPPHLQDDQPVRALPVLAARPPPAGLPQVALAPAAAVFLTAEPAANTDGPRHRLLEPRHDPRLLPPLPAGPRQPRLPEDLPALLRHLRAVPAQPPPQHRPLAQPRPRTSADRPAGPPAHQVVPAVLRRVLHGLLAAACPPRPSPASPLLPALFPQSDPSLSGKAWLWGTYLY